MKGSKAAEISSSLKDASEMNTRAPREGSGWAWGEDRGGHEVRVE